MSGPPRHPRPRLFPRGRRLGRPTRRPRRRTAQNTHICAHTGKAGTSQPTTPNGGSVRLAQAECRSQSVSPLHREGAPSVTALYRIGAVGNRAGQAGDRTQIMHGEPPFLAAGYSPLPGNRRGRPEHVPAEFRCAASGCPAK